MSLEAVVFRRPVLGRDLGIEDWSWVYNSGSNDSPTTTAATSTVSSYSAEGRPSLTAPMDNLKLPDSTDHRRPLIQEPDAATPAPAVVVSGVKKRRRGRVMKNRDDIENQRLIHIAVERNRRKLMNQYLAVLRSLMPPSYAQRGDQASTVGGAINFVRELEQRVQYLQGHRRVSPKKPKPQDDHDDHHTSCITTNSPASDHSVSSDGTDLFSYFTHQYQTDEDYIYNDSIAKKKSDLATVEVTMAENHANLKLVTRRRPRQLSKLVIGLISSLRLTILHLNVTTVDNVVLYALCLKIEDGCELSSANGIATAVYDMMTGMHEETLSFR